MTGENNSGPLRHDEPLFLGAGDVATYHGQAVAWVLGTSVDAARQGASRVVVSYEKLDAILDPADAIRLGSVHTDPQWIRRGDVDAELAGAGEAGHAVVSGEFRMGAQDHFPLETHVSVALTDEDGRMMVHSSTQHPSETQAIVAHALGLSLNEVVVQCVRMGGGFGGKETQANAWAAVAAIGARKTGRAVKVRLDRDRHMILTGKRHPFVARYRVVVGRSGDLRALDLELYADGVGRLTCPMRCLAGQCSIPTMATSSPRCGSVGKSSRPTRRHRPHSGGSVGPRAWQSPRRSSTARRVRLAWTRMTSGHATCIAGRARPTPPTMGRRLVTTGS